MNFSNVRMPMKAIEKSDSLTKSMHPTYKTFWVGRAQAIDFTLGKDVLGTLTNVRGLFKSAFMRGSVQCKLQPYTSLAASGSCF